eukprot:4802100-Prymnesium_polylepis.2
MLETRAAAVESGVATQLQHQRQERRVDMAVQPRLAAAGVVLHHKELTEAEARWRAVFGAEEARKLRQRLFAHVRLELRTARECRERQIDRGVASVNRTPAMHRRMDVRLADHRVAHSVGKQPRHDVRR